MNSKNDGIWLCLLFPVIALSFALGIALGNDWLSLFLFIIICSLIYTLRYRTLKNKKPKEEQKQ